MKEEDMFSECMFFKTLTQVKAIPVTDHGNP
jgi:hypothetical protein